MRMGRWTPVVVWAAVILVSTSLPAAAVPGGPPGLDKAGHFLVYGVLGLLAIRAAIAEGAPPMKAIALTVAAVSVFAAVDEWHQRFVPGRFPDVADWAADVAGATAGIGTMAIFTLRRSARS